MLSKDPNSVKALFRRAVARNHLGMEEEALVDLQKALILDPNNAPVKAEIAKSKKQIAAANKKDKGKYGNMFSKGVSLYDDKATPVVPDKTATVHSASSPSNPQVRGGSEY